MATVVNAIIALRAKLGGGAESPLVHDGAAGIVRPQPLLAKTKTLTLTCTRFSRASKAGLSRPLSVDCDDINSHSFGP